MFNTFWLDHDFYVAVMDLCLLYLLTLLIVCITVHGLGWLGDMIDDLIHRLRGGR